MKFSVLPAVVSLLFALSASSQIWTPATRLNDSAVTNALGQKIVLGTAGSYNNDPLRTKEVVFDNNTATFFDPAAADATGAWAGFELHSTQLVTRIRYIGRAGFPVRMNGVLFQGANLSDFSDAVTLHTANPPAGWLGTTWVDVTLNNMAMLNPFKYVRYIATAPNSYGGNAAEVEFYGVNPLTTAPAPPTVTFADVINWRPNLRWTTGAGTMVAEVQRKLFHEDSYVTVYTVSLRESGNVVSWIDGYAPVNDAAYRIRARNNTGDTAWQDFALAAYPAAVGSWIGTAGSYNNGGATGDKAFDGDISTYFDGPNASNGNGCWTGLDLGTAKMITGIRYLPRITWGSRMNGGIFQGANSADFSDAVLLHTIIGNPPDNSVTAYVLPSAAGPFRFVRYISPNGGWGNVAEAEFDLAPAGPKAPVNLMITGSDLTNDYAVLSWGYDVRNLVTSGNVYRAIAPGGPYTSQTPAGVFAATWTDTNMVAGLLYYYKVALQYAESGGVYEGPMCDYAAFRRAERIDRSWSDLTQVKAGVSILGMGSPYGGNVNVDVDKLFDNSFATFYDSASKNPKPGLNFGSPHGVKRLRYSPRSGYPDRVNGSHLYSDHSVGLTAGVRQGTLNNASYGVLRDLTVTDGSAYQYWYVTRSDTADFYGNLSELEFYGWAASNLADVLIAPMNLVATMDAQQVQVILDWTPGANAVSYRVERAAHGDDNWTLLNTVSVTTFVDLTVTAGTPYDYRVASVRGTSPNEELAYSDTIYVVPYIVGTGTGLKGYYSVNYSRDYLNTESQALVQVDSVINFNWGLTGAVIPSEPASVNNVGITWYGKIVIPFDGDYTFYVTSDDGSALRIDGEFVINWWDGPATPPEYTGSVNLTAGEHTIQLDYYNQTGEKFIKLEWGGAVVREVVPASQLIPLDMPSADIGGWTGRTFGATRLGRHLFNAGDGSIDVYSYGKDLSGTTEGMHYLYQKISGSFILEADVDGELDPASTSAKSMIMVRSALPVGAALIAPAYMFNASIGCKARLTSGAAIFDAAIGGPWITGAAHPTRLRLKRLGSHFTAWYKSTGGEWIELYAVEDSAGSFGKEVYAGVAVCAPPTATAKPLQRGIFSNISLRPAGGLLILLK